jgi:hypothetical protein
MTRATLGHQAANAKNGAGAPDTSLQVQLGHSSVLSRPQWEQRAVKVFSGDIADWASHLTAEERGALTAESPEFSEGLEVRKGAYYEKYITEERGTLEKPEPSPHMRPNTARKISCWRTC